jgi:hypothetical protein
MAHDAAIGWWLLLVKVRRGFGRSKRGDEKEKPHHGV